MSDRLEQAEALLAKVDTLLLELQRSFSGADWRCERIVAFRNSNEWRNRAAAPRSITLAEALAMAQPGDVLIGVDTIEKGMIRAAVRCARGAGSHHWALDNRQGLNADEMPSDAPVIRWHTLRTAHGTYPITADAQPGDDSAEADGLAVGDRVETLADSYGGTYPSGLTGTVLGEHTNPGIGYQVHLDLMQPNSFTSYRRGQLRKLQPADSAPPAEPSIADTVVTSKLKVTGGEDEAIALLRQRVNETSGRVDIVEDETHARLDSIEQQLSDLAAKVEALSKPQVEAVQFEPAVGPWYVPGAVAVRIVDGSDHFGPVLAGTAIRRTFGWDSSLHPEHIPTPHELMSMGFQLVTCTQQPAPDAQAQEGQR